MKEYEDKIKVLLDKIISQLHLELANNGRVSATTIDALSTLHYIYMELSKK